MPSITAIVEGHGEVEAVPLLIRRIATKVAPELLLRIPRPIRTKRDSLVKSGELERAVQLAARQSGVGGAILMLFDADDDCPAELAPKLLARAQAARSDSLIGLVLAKFEYESWFLAAGESLRGQRNLRTDLIRPPDPEAIRGAKEWLTYHMTGPHAYSETLDQAPLTERFDLDAARRTNSFDKCYREIERLLLALE